MQGKRGWIGVLALAALMTAPAAAQDLEQFLDGTWVMQQVERRDDNARWVVQPVPKMGLLVYRIVGPLGAPGAGTVNPPPADRPSGEHQDIPRSASSQRVPETLSAESARAGSKMTMYVDDGRVRLTWVKSREVR